MDQGDDDMDVNSRSDDDEGKDGGDTYSRAPILRRPITFPRLYDNLPRRRNRGRIMKRECSHKWKLRKLLQGFVRKEGTIFKDDHRDQQLPRVVQVESDHGDIAAVSSETKNDSEDHIGTRLLPSPTTLDATAWDDKEDLYRDILIAALEMGGGRQGTPTNTAAHVVPK